MADRNIYTRVYSSTSAGQLVSGKGGNRQLTKKGLLKEFWNHANLSSKRPTALVYTSSRIIDTALRAFTKHYVHGENPRTIFIVFIELPGKKDQLPAGCHAAAALAKECMKRYLEAFTDDDINKFQYEYVFEHAIPTEWVLHRVSLETLLARGLDWRPQFDRWEAERSNRNISLSTSTLREYVGNEFWEIEVYSDLWELGGQLGLFASAFGARAPAEWIANQLYRDCLNYRYATPFQLELMSERGIEAAQIDWWLEELGTSDEYAYFEWFRDYMEEAVVLGKLGPQKALEAIEAEAIWVGL